MKCGVVSITRWLGSTHEKPVPVYCIYGTLACSNPLIQIDQDLDPPLHSKLTLAKGKSTPAIHRTRHLRRENPVYV